MQRWIAPIVLMTALAGSARAEQVSLDFAGSASSQRVSGSYASQLGNFNWFPVTGSICYTSTDDAPNPASYRYFAVPGRFSFAFHGLTFHSDPNQPLWATISHGTYGTSLPYEQLSIGGFIQDEGAFGAPARGVFWLTLERLNPPPAGSSFLHLSLDLVTPRRLEFYFQGENYHDILGVQAESVRVRPNSFPEPGALALAGLGGLAWRPGPSAGPSFS
jgi:hypothetical protein